MGLPAVPLVAGMPVADAKPAQVTKSAAAKSAAAKPAAAKPAAAKSAAAKAAPAAVDAPAKSATLVGVPAPQLVQPMGVVASSASPNAHGYNRPRGTIIGIARPGVAPTYSAPPPEGARPTTSGPPGASPSSPAARGTTFPPGAAKRGGSWTIHAALIGLATVVLLATAWLLMRLWTTAPAMEAQLHPEGSPPKLIVSCPSCPAGSTLDFEAGRTATLAQGKFSFDLARVDLRAGQNTFRGRYSTGSRSSREIDLKVDVPYLVDPVLSPLERGELAVDVVFSIAPTVDAVELEAKPRADDAPASGETVRLTPPANRRGVVSLVHRIPLPPAEADGKLFSTVVEYKVIRSRGAAIPGSLRLAVPYAPLRLGAPGRHPVQTAAHPELLFTGRTAPTATVMVDGAMVPVDKEGLFRVTLVPSASVRVRAFGPRLAARELEVSPVRVRTWSEAERVLTAEAKTPFDDVNRDPDAAAGKWISVIVKVAKVAAEDGRLVAVGETRCSGQATCPAVRILLPINAAVSAPSPGDVLSVIGTVSRGVSLSKGMGMAVEIDASFVRTLARS